MVKKPSAPLTAVRICAVSRLVTSTVTPGNTAPEASVTRPVIAPVAWATTREGKKQMIANRHTVARAIDTRSAMDLLRRERWYATASEVGNRRIRTIVRSAVEGGRGAPSDDDLVHIKVTHDSTQRR